MREGGDAGSGEGPTGERGLDPKQNRLDVTREEVVGPQHSQQLFSQVALVFIREISFI